MSPSLKRAARSPHGPWRPAVPTRARPSSNRGQHGSSRASPPKRVSLGTNTFYAFIFYLYFFIWIFYGFACCICANINVVFIRFGEEIPGMEGLGTGMYNFLSKQYCTISYTPHNIYKSFEIMCNHIFLSHRL